MTAPLLDDERGAISYVDVIMTFGTLVMIAIIAPILFEVYELGQGVVDPLTALLFALVVPLLIIGLIVSMGVAARS